MQEDLKKDSDIMSKFSSIENFQYTNYDYYLDLEYLTNHKQLDEYNIEYKYK